MSDRRHSRGNAGIAALDGAALPRTRRAEDQRDGVASASLDQFVRAVFEPDDEVTVVVASLGRSEARHVRRQRAGELLTPAGQAWLLDQTDLRQRVGVMANGAAAPVRLVAVQVPGTAARGWWGAAPAPSAMIRVPGGPLFALWAIGGSSVSSARTVAQRVSAQTGLAVPTDLVIPLPGLAWPGGEDGAVARVIGMQPAGGYVPMQFETGYFPLRPSTSSDVGGALEHKAAWRWACREFVLGRRWDDVVRVLQWRHPQWRRGAAEGMAIRVQRTLRRINVLPRSGGGGRRYGETPVPDRSGRGVVGRGADGAGVGGADGLVGDSEACGTTTGAGHSLD